jgi:molybdopterin synthase sulfur carrier subunit
MADLTLLYFAWVRERIGTGEERISQPLPGTSISALLDALSAKSDGHAAAFADRKRLSAALDQRFVSIDTPIGEAKELALFPPVTGG